MEMFKKFKESKTEMKQNKINKIYISKKKKIKNQRINPSPVSPSAQNFGTAHVLPEWRPSIGHCASFNVDAGQIYFWVSLGFIWQVHLLIVHWLEKTVILWDSWEFKIIGTLDI